MTHRTFFQYAVRVTLGSLVIIGGILVPVGIPVVPAVLGTQLAYDGSERRIIAWTVGFLAVIELVFALDLGVLSLSYLVAAGVLSLVSRLVSIPPWAHSDGWWAPDAVRAVLASLGTAAVIIAGSSAVRVLYGDGLLLRRLSVQLTPEQFGALAFCCVVALMVLRRIDIPFRRRIRFGT